MKALLCLLLALVALSCAAPRSQTQPRADSVVSLLQLVGPPPCIGFPEEQCSYANRYEPHCAAFAIVHDQQTMLVTASHCVPEWATNLTPLRFYAPSGWGHGLAYLMKRDDGADVAFLAVGEPGMVSPLRVGKSPLVGEVVSSYSPLYRTESIGRVTNWVGPEFFETNQTVAVGWSGSPILDSHGDVVGVVSRCPADFAGGTEKRCAPGRVVATSALCFRRGGS